LAALQKSGVEYAPAPRPAPADDVDRLHDIYLPIFLLILGCVGIVSAFWQRPTAIRIDYFRFLQFAGAYLLLKGAIISFWLWRFAQKAGESFGDTKTTVLKIVSLTVVLDAVMVWSPIAMRQMGVIFYRYEPAPPGTVYLWLISLLLVSLLIARFVYKLGDEEAKGFGILISVSNFLFNFLVLIVIAVVIHVRAGTPLPWGRMPMGGSASSIAAIDKDKKIHDLIALGAPMITEGGEWKRTHTFDRSAEKLGALIDQLYAAGAKKVWVTLRDLYVELPADADAANECRRIVGVYARSLPVSSGVTDTGDYVSVNLR
jgi:hypothetical protein